MRMRILVVVLALFVVVVLASVSSAQDLLQPDDRYRGYPKSLIQWTSELPDLVACEKDEYYEPSDFHLAKYVSRVKVAGVRVQEFDECRWMLTSNKWRYVLRPKGTRHLVDSLGRDLFDDGSPTGKPCKNPSPFGFEIKPKGESKPTVPPLRAQLLPQPPVPQVRQEIPPSLPPSPPLVTRQVVVLPPPPPPVVIYDYVYYIPLNDLPLPPRNSWCGKKCRWTLVAIGGAAAGYAAWYYWPCPPGTVRR